MKEERFMRYSYPTQLFHFIPSSGYKILNDFPSVGFFSPRGMSECPHTENSLEGGVGLGLGGYGGNEGGCL